MRTTTTHPVTKRTTVDNPVLPTINEFINQSKEEQANAFFAYYHDEKYLPNKAAQLAMYVRKIAKSPKVDPDKMRVSLEKCASECSCHVSHYFVIRILDENNKTVYSIILNVWSYTGDVITKEDGTQSHANGKHIQYFQTHGVRLDTQVVELYAGEKDELPPRVHRVLYSRTTHVDKTVTEKWQNYEVPPKPLVAGTYKDVFAFFAS